MDLSMLNREQRIAAETLDGPVLILAGAGSGKTRALTYRIANMIDHGIPAYRIMALTFTNKAAREMKTRVEGLIGTEAVAEAWISTFHSTCARILRRDIEKLGYSRSFVIYDDDDQGRLLKEIYSHAKTRAFSTFAISSYPGNFLNAGQCIFAIDSTAGATWMGSDAPMLDIHKEQVVPFTTLVRPIPQYDPDHPQMISQGPSICVFNKADSQEVLASWLFAQYLLSNEVQLGYAETEGYLPVTTKAQQSAEYLDYMSRKGENNQEYYDIKIEASELLQKYTGDTFVTPVFNGSASLRSAAGQLIENVCKSARRKEEMSDAYLEKQFEAVSSLYRLDQIKVITDGEEGETVEAQEPEKTGWDALPGASQALLITLPCIWLVIGAFSLYRAKKSKRKN